MKKGSSKAWVDVLSIAFILTAIITGIMLHHDVWVDNVYDDTFLWGLHETVGIALIVSATIHCVQHSFWFKNFGKIKFTRKWLTTLLLILGLTVAVTGVPLMFGSHSALLSRIHFVGGILFTLAALIHAAKRLPRLRTLL